MSVDMMRDAVLALDSARKSFFSQTVTYVTQGGQTCSLPAAQGKSVFRVRNVNGATICIYTRDFIVSRSDLPALPQAFDKIQLNGVTYEVCAPENAPVYRISGTDNLMCRIHTAVVSAETF